MAFVNLLSFLFFGTDKDVQFAILTCLLLFILFYRRNEIMIQVNKKYIETTTTRRRRERGEKRKFQSRKRGKIGVTDTIDASFLALLRGKKDGTYKKVKKN